MVHKVMAKNALFGFQLSKICHFLLETSVNSATSPMNQYMKDNTEL